MFRIWFLHFKITAKAYLFSPNDFEKIGLYHSIVFFNPSLKGILDLKPNSDCALEVSSILLGWPSGFDESQMIFPLKSVSLVH